MLLSRSSVAAVQALARSRGLPLLATTPTFTRSFSSTQVAARLPLTFFHPNRSSSLTKFQARNTTSQAGGAGVPPLPPSPPGADGVAAATAAPKPRRKSKWSFSRYGIPGPEFSAKHPWLATLLRILISLVFGFTAVGGIILLHDMCTYQKRHVDRVPCNPLALKPRLGGPKNLPIIDMLLDDEEDDTKLAMAKKPRLVIVGGGWGAVALLKNLQPTAYNVTIISPTNYFCFTPLLPSACVGTVEVRSLVEPLRKLLARVHGHYLNGSAMDIDMSERLLEVELPAEDGYGTRRAYIPYDKLVIAVGAKSNEHGVKGLEYCHQLKTVPDAQKIRRQITNNLETASLPTTTPEERKQLLSFVVCGGGPTGVEFAAELSDMLQEDMLDYYPKLLKNDISVTLIQSRDHILNTYSEKISDYAEKHFKRENINVIMNARVTEVTPDDVKISVKEGDGKLVQKSVPASFVLWSTGIAMQPFTKRMVELLPNQYHSKACQVDAYLRVEGAPTGTVYAIGDAATVHLNMLGDLLTLWDRFDTNKDDKITREEWSAMAEHIKKKYPLARGYLGKIHEVFEEFDKDHDHHLSLNEVAEMFHTMSKKVTALPATAQVATQEGAYLGKMFTKLAKEHTTLQKNDIPDLDDDVYFHPFKYRPLGNLAYIGNTAAFDLGPVSSAGGLLAMYAWRSVYWSEQVSMRTRFMIMQDWIKRGMFGRDLSKF